MAAVVLTAEAVWSEDFDPAEDVHIQEDEPKAQEGTPKPDVGPREVNGQIIFSVEISKTAEMNKVGLSVRWIQESKALEVKEVKEGLVEKYNISCSKDVMVLSGDKILEVNGITEDTQKMLDAVANSETLKFVFARPSAGR